MIDAGAGTSWTLTSSDIIEADALDRVAEIMVAIRARRMLEDTWITDRDARRFRLTAPFAVGWDRSWGSYWGS